MFTSILKHCRTAVLVVLVALAIGPAAHAQSGLTHWTSGGTFDFSNLPGESGVSTFSSSPPFDFTDVRFHHAAVQGSAADGWLLTDGTFEITAANGDLLQGALYPDFHYNADVEMNGIQDGASFFFFTGGTGRFAGAEGGGLLIGTALFSSERSGVTTHFWEGSISLVPEPATAVLGAIPIALLFMTTRQRAAQGTILAARGRQRLR